MNKFLKAFNDSLNVCPHLVLEIGYTRPTGWMVHIWDATGAGIKHAPKIILTQDPSRKKACHKAAKQLRQRFL